MTHTSLRTLVDDAIAAWQDFTGVSADTRSWTMGDWEMRDMHESLAKMLALEPEGTTTAMLLECFLRAHLESKTFTAAGIMKDFTGTMDYLQRAEKLFALVQADLVANATAAFRGKLLASADRYGVRTPAFEAMVDDPDVLPFLRRDALCAMETLQPFQFLDGAPDTAVPQIVPIVHQAWDVTSMLEAVRAMPVSGIAVVLVRDPAHPDRSYFGFAVRNGGRVFFLTDKSRPVFPGQEDVLASRGSRGTGRSYSARAWRHRFPYQILRTSEDERGDLVFERETAPVLAGRDLVPLMHIRDLPADQAIWLTMMASLVADKFWNQTWTAPALSYTGAMITDRARLVRGSDGALVAQAEGYTPITLDTVTHADVSQEGVEKVMPGLSKGVHAWMEERYAAKVPQAVLNIVSTPKAESTLAIARRPNRDRDWARNANLPVNADGLVAIPNTLQNWERPESYPVLGFSPGSFGTEAEIQADRVWIARRNMTSYVQKLADEEYEDRHKDVQRWLQKAMEQNLPELLTWVAPEAWPPRADGSTRPHQLLVRTVDSHDWHHGTYPTLVLGSNSVDRKCALDGTKATWRVRLVPYTADDLALLCGVARSKLPDVLQHWTKERVYVGNSLLDKLDPMDAHITNPWRKLDTIANIFLSKRGYARVGGTRKT